MLFDSSFFYYLIFHLIFINFIISKKTILNKEKMSTFECGFNPSSSVLLFSTQFSIIKLIFLIFDIEIALLLPLIFISMNFNPFIISYSFTFLFILICNIGLFIEYNQYSLDWKTMLSKINNENFYPFTPQLN